MAYVARRVKEEPKRNAHILHHTDADGISARFVLEEALREMGFDVKTIGLERTYKSVLRQVFDSHDGIFFLTDLGSNSEETIRRMSKGKLTVVLDHHGTFSFEGRKPLQDDNVYLLISTRYGVSGDKYTSAAALAYFFATELFPAVRRHAHIALLGGIGDKNYLRDPGGEARFPSLGLDQRVFEEAGPDRSRFEEGHYKVRLNGGFELGERLTSDITLLGSAAYYAGGIDVAMSLIQEGYSKSVRATIDRLRRKREQARESVLRSIREGRGTISAEDIFYFPTYQEGVNHLIGMGTKTVGELCDHVVQLVRSGHHKYRFLEEKGLIMGGQIVEAIPVGGATINLYEWDQAAVKVSIRSNGMPPGTSSETPYNVAAMVVSINPAFADGCHKDRGATVVPITLLPSFVDAAQTYLKEPDKSRPMEIPSPTAASRGAAR